MKESRQEYIERMAAIAIKKNWQSGDFEWLNNHLGKNDLVADIQKRLTPLAPDAAKAEPYFDSELPEEYIEGVIYHQKRRAGKA